MATLTMASSVSVGSVGSDDSESMNCCGDSCEVCSELTGSDCGIALNYVLPEKEFELRPQYVIVYEHGGAFQPSAPGLKGLWDILKHTGEPSTFGDGRFYLEKQSISFTRDQMRQVDGESRYIAKADEGMVYRLDLASGDKMVKYADLGYVLYFGDESVVMPTFQNGKYGGLG